MTNLTARKIHKQMYPATYNFKDDTVGDEPAGWTVAKDANCSGLIIDSLDGHSKVLQLLDENVAGLVNTLVPITQGLNTTIEFYFTKSSVAATYRIEITIKEGATSLIHLRFNSNDSQYFDGGAYQTLQDNFMVANTLSHFKIVLDDTANTFDCYIDDVLVSAGAGLTYWNNSTSGANAFLITTNSGATGYSGYFDAVSWDSDPDYNVGDNIFWRSYVMTDDDFNDDDITETGTSITWVDSATTASTTTLEPEFNEHKKVLKQVASGGSANCYHTIGIQSKNGVYEWWLKFGDKTQDSRWFLDESGFVVVSLRVEGGVFQYEDQSGPTWQTISGPTVTNNTWYHIRVLVTDAATDTFDMWIDNVLRVAAGECRSNQTSGINRMYLQAVGVNSEVYLDGFGMVKFANYEDADNRRFEYNTQSFDDITSNIGSAEVFDEAYLSSTAIIKISKDLVTLSALHILHLLDINSDLRFEGNYFKKTTNAGIDIFTFHSLNKSNLKKPNTYTASSLDPSQILLNIFTDIGQASTNDARLQYYEEDDPAGSHSPTIINTPNREIIRRMAYHSNRYAIIKPNGVFTLDADRVPSNGAYTISISTGEIRGDPLIEDFNSQINKVTVYGAFDPERGIFFNGESVDTTAQGDGTGVLEYSKWYPDLRSDADCTTRAVAIRTPGTGLNPKIITATLLNVYANIGEVINFAYSPKSFSAQNVYAKKVSHNLMSGISHYELSTGIFEDWGLSQEQWSLATEGERQINDGIFQTDINTVYLRIIPSTGATETVDGVRLDAVNEIAVVYWYTPPNVDISRVIDIYFQFLRGDSAGDTITIKKTLIGKIADGGSDTVTQWTNVADTLPASATATEQVKKFTLTAANNFANYKYTFIVTMDEASRNIVVRSIAIVYFIKRAIS